MKKLIYSGGIKVYRVNINVDGVSEELVRERLLTIGIITKNECEKLERCLKSLMPIKEALDCEIIVTDTGSTDNTVEMSKKYADKVIKFDWIDDFSAARNKGIEESTGIWFMWIDSDEWVDDPKPLIEFFKSGEYQNYASATIEMMDCSTGFEDSITSPLARLTIRMNKTRFKGAIHENIDIISPKAEIKMLVYHDGYSFDNFNEKLKKHNRNIEILLQRNIEFPKDITIIRYIVDQYRFISKFADSNIFCEKGLDILSKNNNNDLGEAYEIHFNIMKATNLLDMNELENAIETLVGLEDINPKLKRRFLDIYFILSEAYSRLGNNIKSMEFAKKYIELYLKLDELDKSYITEFYEISNKVDIIKRMFFLCIKDCNDIELRDYLEKFGKKSLEKRIFSSVKEYVRAVFALANDIKRYEVISGIYDLIYERKLELDSFEFEYMLCEYISEDIEFNRNLFEVISNKNDYTDMSLICTFIIFDLDEDYRAKETICKILESDKLKNAYIKSELFYGTLKYKIEYEKIDKFLDVFKAKEIVNKMLIRHTEFIDIVIDYFEEKELCKNNIRCVGAITNILDEYISNNYVSEELKKKIYKLYERILPLIISEVYKSKISEINMDFYPPIVRFGYFINKANEFKAQKNLSEYIRLLKRSVKEYPYLDKAIESILEEIQIDIQSEDERRNEFEELAVKIKQKIYELITLGEFEEALTVVCQLQSIMPNDKELKELKSRLTSF